MSSILRVFWPAFRRDRGERDFLVETRVWEAREPRTGDQSDAARPTIVDQRALGLQMP
jgi:hypothetical protein